MDLLPIQPVKFNRALNTGQIGWKFPGRIGYHPNEFNWHLSTDLLPIQPVEFDWALITGQIG